MSKARKMPTQDNGAYGFSGFNDLDMKVIFVMTPEYNDDENENRPTEELLRTSLREVYVGHLDYEIADYTLQNMHLIIDNNEVECINGEWREVKEFYFDKQTRVAFKLTGPVSSGGFTRLDKLYVSGGSQAATKINNFLAVNDIRRPRKPPTL